MRVLIITKHKQKAGLAYIHKMASAHKIYLYSCTTLHLICSAGLCWHMPVRYQITEEMFSLFACSAGLCWHMHVWYQITEVMFSLFVRMQWI